MYSEWCTKNVYVTSFSSTSIQSWPNENWKIHPTRNVGCNGNALVNCIPLSDFAKYGIVIVLFVCSEFHDVTLGGWEGTLCVGWKDPKINPIHNWYAAMQ